MREYDDDLTADIRERERESDRKSFGSKATVSQSCVRIGCQRIRRIVSFHFSGHVSQML